MNIVCMVLIGLILLMRDWRKNGRPDIKEGISEKELVWLKYPSDTEIDDVGVRGIYLSNYIKWSGSQNADLVESKYGWKPFESEQERTYRKISNLDDIHENGIHDYMKFIKFGYDVTTMRRRIYVMV